MFVATAVQALLEAVGLGYLLLRSEGLDSKEEWADSLSLGEQQRLGACVFVSALVVVRPLSMLIAVCRLRAFVLSFAALCDHGREYQRAGCGA